MTEINIKKGQYDQQSLSTIKEIYFNSFPAEERRQWSSIIQLLSQNNSPYNIYLIFLIISPQLQNILKLYY